jgi:hypothetical protein
MFSWFCKGGCGHPIKMDEEIIQVKAGKYDGYGRTEDYDCGGGAFWHQKCFFAQYGEIDTSEGERDPDQGFGYPHPDFLPEGTKLFDPEYDVFKGVEKVGLCIDVSGSTSFDLLRRGHLLDGAKAAMHYLGTKEVEVITFEAEVVRQETMQPDGLWAVGYDKDGEWSKGGGGTDLRPPIEAAVKAGCGAIVVASDLYGPLPEDPGVPVIWLCPVADSLIEKNYEAGKRGQDLYDGAPAPGYGTVIYREAY